MHFEDTTPVYSSIAWTRVDLQPGEKVGHYFMIYGHEDASGVQNRGSITNLDWKVLTARGTNEMGLSALTNNVIAVLPGPDNADYATRIVGDFLGYNLKLAVFDLSSLNITNANYVALVPKSRAATPDLSVIIAFSSGGTNAVGTNSNFYTPAPGINSDPPGFLDRLGGYPGDYFATAVTAVESSFTLSGRKEGTNMVLAWDRSGDKVLEKKSDLTSGQWEEVPGSRATNSVSVALSEPQAFFRLERKPDPALAPLKK